MSEFLVLPTWLLMKMLPLPEDHPWKGKQISLHDWARNGTELLYHFSFMFWLFIAVGIFIIGNL